MKSAADIQAELIALSNEREKALADFKERGLELTRAYEEAVAVEKAQAQVQNMSEAEREAFTTALTQTIMTDGIASEITVGEVQ